MSEHGRQSVHDLAVIRIILSEIATCHSRDPSKDRWWQTDYEGTDRRKYIHSDYSHFRELCKLSVEDC